MSTCLNHYKGLSCTYKCKSVNHGLCGSLSHKQPIKFRTECAYRNKKELWKHWSSIFKWLPLRILTIKCGVITERNVKKLMEIKLWSLVLVKYVTLVQNQCLCVHFFALFSYNAKVSRLDAKENIAVTNEWWFCLII
jgi:hypothetical protein